MNKKFCDICNKDIPQPKDYFLVTILRNNYMLTSEGNADKNFNQISEVCNECMDKIGLIKVGGM